MIHGLKNIEIIITILALSIDHDYFKDLPEDIFLKSMNLIQIDLKTQAEIEFNTLGQSINKHWFFE